MESDATRICCGALPVPFRYVQVRSKGHPNRTGDPVNISLELKPRNGCVFIIELYSSQYQFPPRIPFCISMSLRELNVGQ